MMTWPDRARVLGVLVIASLLGSCTPTSISVKPGYFEEDKKVTARAIEQFHNRINAGQVDEIYNNASSDFRRAQGRDGLSRAMQETRSRFGKFERVTFSELNVIMGAPVQIRAVYNSVFEKGETTELFVFVKQDD